MNRAGHIMVQTDNTLQEQTATDNKEFRIRTICVYIAWSSVQKISCSRLPEYYEETFSDECRNKNSTVIRYLPYFFLISWVGGGVESKLGPLGMSATEWPIVLAPGDCDDGEFGGKEIGRGNRSTRRKPTPEPLCPPQIPLARPGLKPGPPRWEASD
jgi:hypothetical protein